jgi:hypothetical protein
VVAAVGPMLLSVMISTIAATVTYGLCEGRCCLCWVVDGAAQVPSGGGAVRCGG